MNTLHDMRKQVLFSVCFLFFSFFFLAELIEILKGNQKRREELIPLSELMLGNTAMRREELMPPCEVTLSIENNTKKEGPAIRASGENQNHVLRAIVHPISLHGWVAIAVRKGLGSGTHPPVSGEHH